ncbi:MAG TPA: hypothetical protein DC047_15965 [Blastocatellia bacterium]|nr:hypothetical protein [Blastocatellia bacterium]
MTEVCSATDELILYLGSTRALTNDDGEVVEEIAYDSFGNGTGSALTRYTYIGREYDSDTHYYRARFYDPGTGSLNVCSPKEALCTNTRWNSESWVER